MRPRWHITIYGPGVINQTVREQGGFPTRAWTRFGAETKALRWYARVTLDRPVTRLHTKRL